MSITEADKEITVSFIGYQTQKIAITMPNKYDVSLAIDVEQLEEVVVVGYGTARKSDDRFCSVSKNDELNVVATGDVNQALQGGSRCTNHKL